MLAPSQPHGGDFERLKSDYVLMLVQCVLGMVVMFLPGVISRRLKIEIPLGHDGFVCYLSLLCNLSWGSQKLLLPYFVVGYGFALVQRGDDRRIGLLICGAIQ